ncbi:MAG: hypothetical protein ACPG77_20175, partial [Nannocystaceae bacterium]
GVECRGTRVQLSWWSLVGVLVAVQFIACTSEQEKGPYQPQLPAPAQSPTLQPAAPEAESNRSQPAVRSADGENKAEAVEKSESKPVPAIAEPRTPGVPPTFEISNALLARGEGPSAPTRQTPVPHTSVTHPLEGASARVLRSLKPTTPDIDKIYALATTSVGVPSWAALMTADPGATRDDDLSTGWSCTLAQGKPCALIATFDKPVQLRAIRLFSGLIGHKSQSIQTLRVHTDAGVAEVSNLSVGKHRHIYLDKPVTTRQLVLEVVKTAGRPKTLPVALAELEIYGESGLARAPLNLDPSLAHLRFDASPWEASEDVL